MLFSLLNYLQTHAGAPITELRRVLDLPSEMAANLVVQLEDAGLIASPPLTTCHHAEGASGCGGCGQSACQGGAAFERGCCGMNGPYRLTPKGRAFLAELVPGA